MPLETLNQSPPPLFAQGPSVLSRLIVLSALALFLMVADSRFQLVQPLRSAIATVLYPAQWLALRPVLLVQAAAGYVTDLSTARRNASAAHTRLTEQSQRAGQVEQLLLENRRLRALLQLGDRLDTPAQAAEVLYEATDPFSRRVVIGKGRLQGVTPGSPVLDESGLLGQITRVYPFVSEITLLVDNEQLTPVVNTRTGVRAVAHGSASARTDTLELRYVSPDEDMRPGDLLATSGVGGVYPPGLPVARVVEVGERHDSSFIRVRCEPVAQLHGVTYVMVLQPLADSREQQPDADTDTKVDGDADGKPEARSGAGPEAEPEPEPEAGPAGTADPAGRPAKRKVSP